MTLMTILLALAIIFFVLPGGGAPSAAASPVGVDDVTDRRLAAGDPAWHPNYSAGWLDGYCTFTIDDDTPSYESELACCRGAYAGQVSGRCLSKLPRPPTSSPVEEDGATGVWWYPLYDRQYTDGYCVNRLPIPNGRVKYPSNEECCSGAYLGQSSGKIT